MVGVDVVGDFLSGLVEGFPFGAPGAALFELAEPGLDERLGLGVAVAAAAVGDATGRQVLAEVAGGELSTPRSGSPSTSSWTTSSPRSDRSATPTTTP